MNRYVLFKIAAFFLGLILAIGISEGLVRMIGVSPWSYGKHDANEPTMHETEPVLGWRNKKGNYVVPPYDPSGQTFHVNFLDNGQRRTGVNTTRIGDQLVTVGDSFTMGWAISDNETYPWKLQEKYPSLNVLNYGTGGYGSYQSLLVLERELPRLTSPKYVLYGFNQQHEERNVAPGSWMRALISYSRRGHVDVPFASWDTAKGLVRHPPERYLALPFRESLAIVASIENAYMWMKTRNRLLNKRLVTERILLQMDRVSVANGATFFVVFLEADDRTKNRYMNFLGENGIPFMDCVYEQTNEMRVPGDWHPNGKMNTLWAECISTALDLQLESRMKPGR